MNYKFLILLFVCIQLQACERGSQANTLTVTTEQESFSFTVQIAGTDRERQMGLMGRQTLGDRQGMFFIFPALSLSSFWMKNTPLSLDIIFIGEGLTVQEVAANTTPFSEELITPQAPYLYVLEVKAGTAGSLGLKIGDSVTLPE